MAKIEYGNRGVNFAEFKSTEQTGNGAEQSVAHGLAKKPDQVLIIPSNLTGGAYVVTEGNHDSTNVKVTVTSGEKYIVWAKAIYQGRVA